jgi:AcrR family transcriptional regulator
MQTDNQGHGRAPHQLPPGRHGLSRRYVAEHHRVRILDAVADVVSLVGYAAMSVEAIVGAAGVSRRTFYDNFKSKEDAFLAAYDQIGTELFDRVRAAYAASDSFPTGVVACLEAFFQFSASQPQYADMLIVEVLAAGQVAIERRNAVLRTLAELLHAGAETVRVGVRPPALIAETIIGGIYEIVYSRILHGQVNALPDLLPDVAYSMMLPYLGHERAADEVSRLATARS